MKKYSQNKGVAKLESNDAREHRRSNKTRE
jgi:hypothetical protein